MSLLAADAVSRAYETGMGWGERQKTRVLDAVSVSIEAGETVGLLGRSGCGKSTLARLLVGLERPDAGCVRFEGRPLDELSKAERLAFRRSVQMVFQDSLGAVDPRSTVRAILAEPLRHLLKLSKSEREPAIADLLRRVGLEPRDADKLPGQMSGGQLQRVCIARALAPQPKLIVLDEAVSNLDLHLQIQMLDLFEHLRRETGLAYLFVTHDLRLVERFASRVLVMDEGRVCEEAAVSRPLALASPAGRALGAAVLPAMPGATRRPARAAG
ncbi:nickel import ATP-binding protein NikE [Fulvimarina endophytica]|uniref:Nickel import ATP-binding protein NikE n=1 Tax=Fulvimarina endophytica TaxID=2293836 RepID=A0A371WZU9_9HYPH|nr:nickel import ATP-binding protein NikE [Fulvimarina endophytica]RFC62497.1 nickel import ATP-binding protein NikE [Fulvimarina endophytica]